MQRARSVCERDGSADVAMRESTEAELRGLPVMGLLAEAEAAGITIAVEGDHLRIRGPRRAKALGRLLLDRKTEVLALLMSSRQRAAEASAPTEDSAASGPPVAADPARWDAQRAAAIVAEVDAQIEAALLSAAIAANSARRNVLANERQIVRQLAQHRDPFLWQWPRALGRLLQCWAEWDAERGQ